MAMVDNRITGVVNSAAGATEPASQVTNITHNHAKTHKAHAKHHAAADKVTISNEAQNAAASNLTTSAVKPPQEAESAAKSYQHNNSQSKIRITSRWS